MADLTKTEYPTILATVQPSQAVNILQDRLRTINKINNDVADWLEERRHVEEQYANSLRKLARKQPHDGTTDMGVFTSPWARIVEATESLAESHQLLALKIETDVAKPLRDYATSNSDLRAMPTIQGRLASMVRDVEAAQKNNDRLKSKNGRTDGSARDVQEATAQWDTQAPYIFEKLQVIDENRLAHLRDVLTQFETHEVDQVERNRVTAEQCLNSLLNVEVEEEIGKFAQMCAEGRAPISDTRRTSRMPSNANGASFVPPLAGRNDEVAGQRPDSLHEEKEKKKGFGGFKRLGTVMGRRKDKATTPVQTPSKRGSTSRFGSSFNLHSDREASTTPSRPQNGRAPSSGLASVVDTSRQDDVATPPPATAATTLPSRPIRNESMDDIMPVNGSRSVMPNNNGTTSGTAPQLQEPLQPSALVTMSQEPLQPIASMSYGQERPVQGATQPTSIVSAYMGNDIPARPVDPITQAQQEAASYGDQSGQPYKLDIRNAPIAEEGADADSAMSSLANTLRAQAPQPKRSNTNRGRRDVRNTIFMPSPPVFENSTTEQYPFPPGGPPMPIMSPTIAALQSSQSFSRPGDDSNASDTHSIRSSRSVASLGPQVKHPDLTQPGLNSSIVETVSAWFEQGQLTKAVVVGELALAYNQANTFPSLSRTESIRLDNFQILEKVAPNPSFIEQQNKPGEYTVDTISIPRTSIAFKYQIHLDSGMHSMAQIPLLIKPTWKIESRQTSVILAYSLNPAFHNQQQSVTFASLNLIIHLEGARATGCQSKPTGDFSRERSVIYWKLNGVVLRPGEQPQKLLARFATESEARPGKVEAKWEIVGGGGGSGVGLGVSRLESGGAGGSGFDASDPFADEGAGGAGSWREVSSARRLISGTYTAT